MSDTVQSRTDQDGTHGVWLELSLQVHMEAVEPVTELFARYGYNEGVVIEEPFLQEPDGDNLRVDATRPVTIRTFLARADTDDVTLSDIRRGLFHLNQMMPVGELTVTERNEEDWANAWKEHFRPVRVGKRIVVRPPWREFEGDADDIVVVLDPGMAFGTGTHPTTRLAMLGVEETVLLGQAILDVGTGSGVLAIAAAMLGASRVDSCDIEPVAVRTARENIDRNGLSDIIRVEEGSAGKDGPYPGRYPVVVANIIARVLIELADDIVGSVADDGTLVLSGIIEGREPDVLDTYSRLGFSIVERGQIEDWVSLTLRRGT